jgi:CheY-like chemotaxis protein/anti-sigma regulatory factor (Ser/Thr protein kinase)
VIGMTGLLMDTDLTARQQEYAEIVRRSGESLLGLINEILDFSKIEAGKVVSESHPFDLCEAIEDVIELLAPTAREKKIELLLEYSEQTPRKFVGDGPHIRQVVTNLVSNAVKFTFRGHVLVSVEYTARDGANGDVQVRVRDTGVGIPQEKMGLLFEKFSQVDGSNTRRHGGTGLGLAISKRLVNLMGGTVGVESRAGEGSVFWFDLPLLRDQQNASQAEPPAGLNGKRAIVLGDSEVSCRVLVSQLRGWGLRSDSLNASDGVRAMRAAKAAGEPYHFALLDCPVLQGDGLAFAREIRSESALRSCAIVLLYPDRRVADLTQAAAGAVDACLSKPSRHAQLRNSLADALVKRQEIDQASVARVKQQGAIQGGNLGGKFAGQNRKVLVVEDNLVNQKVACRLLDKLGLSTDVAVNGREAIEMTAVCSYDLILMDCQMPEMDGYEATRAIRGREGPKGQIAIVAITADALTGSRERCLASGMDDFLSKPVNLDELCEALSRWLPQRDLSAQ